MQMGYIFGRDQGFLSWKYWQRSVIGGNIGSLEGGHGMADGGIINSVPNLASFLLTSGSRTWYGVWVYLPLNYTPEVHHGGQALEASKGNGGNPLRRPEQMTAGTARYQVR